MANSFTSTPHFFLSNKTFTYKETTIFNPLSQGRNFSFVHSSNTWLKILRSTCFVHEYLFSSRTRTFKLLRRCRNCILLFPWKINGGPLTQIERHQTSIAHFVSRERKQVVLNGQWFDGSSKCKLDSKKLLKGSCQHLLFALVSRKYVQVYANQ